MSDWDDLDRRLRVLEAQKHPRWATIYETAKHLRVDSETIRRWTRDGRLTAHGQKGARRWNLNEVDAAFMGRNST